MISAHQIGDVVKLGHQFVKLCLMTARLDDLRYEMNAEESSLVSHSSDQVVG